MTTTIEEPRRSASSYTKTSSLGRPFDSAFSSAPPAAAPPRLSSTAPTRPIAMAGPAAGSSAVAAAAAPNSAPPAAPTAPPITPPIALPMRGLFQLAGWDLRDDGVGRARNENANVLRRNASGAQIADGALGRGSLDENANRWSHRSISPLSSCRRRRRWIQRSRATQAVTTSAPTAIARTSHAMSLIADSSASGRPPPSGRGPAPGGSRRAPSLHAPLEERHQADDLAR